jgi:hypothetical protein
MEEPYTGVIMDLSAAWAVSPWLATLIFLGTTIKEYVKGKKNEANYVISFTTISYIAMTFEKQRKLAEIECHERSEEDAREFIEDFSTDLTCDYRDDLKKIMT